MVSATRPRQHAERAYDVRGEGLPPGNGRLGPIPQRSALVGLPGRPLTADPARSGSLTHPLNQARSPMTAQPESPIPLAVPDAPSRTTVLAKMARILAAVPRVQKSGENAFHHYRYVTESDLLEAIRGLLGVERVAFFFATEEVRERPTGAKDKAGRDETVTTVSGTATFCCGAG